MMPPWLAPMSLSALAGDQVRARLHRFLQRRLLVEAEAGEIHQRPGPDVVDHDQSVGVADPHQFGQRHFGGEAENLVVARMHAEDGGRVRRDRPLVVAGVGLVGRAHLDELHAAGRHDVGQAERAADLDQLPARDDDLAAAGDGVEHDRRWRRRCC